MTSGAGMVTLVPPSRLTASSNFFSSNEGWRISGNAGDPARTLVPDYDPTNRAYLDRFVYGTDVLTELGSQDVEQWYFKAPPVFLGNQGARYKSPVTRLHSPRVY